MPFPLKDTSKMFVEGESFNHGKLVSHVNFYVVNVKINIIFIPKFDVSSVLSAYTNRENNNFR